MTDDTSTRECAESSDRIESNDQSDSSDPAESSNPMESSHPAESTDEPNLRPGDQRAAVRERYSTIATESDSGGCCGEAASTETDSSCCGTDDETSPSRALGYSREELNSVADGADLGLGCGNPNAIADLEAGETVLDLGSGGGFDCFLAANEVGDEGRVLGVDMTPEMVELARENAEKNGSRDDGSRDDGSNDERNRRENGAMGGERNGSSATGGSVEFRLGEIEHLPVADETVDVIISNCVINLSPDKARVFEEAYRVLRPGGRLAITDVVLTAEIPPSIQADPASVAACVGGASTIDTLEGFITDAGFEAVSIRPKADSASFIREWSDEVPLESYLVSAVIEAEKPARVG